MSLCVPVFSFLRFTLFASQLNDSTANACIALGDWNPTVLLASEILLGLHSLETPTGDAIADR